MTNGDQIFSFGGIAKAEHTGSGDIVAGHKQFAAPEPMPSAIDDLNKAINDLRQHLDGTARAEVDAALQQIGQAGSSNDLAEPLTKLKRIAAAIGIVGQPAISAINALWGTFSP
ncbi:hypothetical protein ACFQ7F_40630 [Streptomyces sp. NPDC056486]|uniref:hypothetical protein n=1 Tax=Streptomyces sp. NPDC056486 TaxID=3345835 RepID=UPI0036AE712D